MAKLPVPYPGTTHEGIIQLLHDEVVSLCQKNYNTASGLEIDGIICISILDTKEQQVVKIHKTLKSVFADSKEKPKRQKTHKQPSYWLGGSFKDTGCPSSELSKNGPENFQNDINALSNLLRDTNAAIHKEFEKKSAGESKQSKRKRRQPKQRVTNNAEPTAESNKTDDSNVATLTNNNPLPEEDRHHNSPGINPFIHKDVVKIKEEKIDPEYDAVEQTQPKISNVSSLSKSDKDKSELSGGIVEKTKVSALIERLIEKEIPRDKKDDKTFDSQEKDSMDTETTKDNAIESCEGDVSEFQAIEVKVEKITDESEYGGSQEYNQGDITAAYSDYVGTGGSNSETENFEYHPEWHHNEHKPGGEIGRTALIDRLHEKGSLALTGYPRETGREERDPQGRSWIEMVKDNVNKYQAALERTSKSRNEVENGTGSTLQTSALAKSSSSLVALLKKPASASPQSKEVTSNAIMDSARNSRGSSVPIQGTDQISDRSTSSSPIVKIEVDEDMTHEMYSKSDGEVYGDNNGNNANTETSLENNGVTIKTPQGGKLESRYPALFSHLQQAKQAGNDNQDPSDSLVDRLPFISFQELFSQAATGAPTPRLSESTTMQLLAQARINPYPAKEKSKGQRKVWNWKKRLVRPRDAEGRIISPIPINLKAKNDNGKNRSHLGLHASIKKTFSKKGQKSQKEQDRDWQPGVDNVDVDTDNENNPGTSQSERQTRLSCGEKPRINFAELENSDFEIDDGDNDVEDIEMLPATSGNQSVDNAHVYGEGHGEGNSVFPGGGGEQLLAAFSASSEQLNSASGSATEQYKCSLCGLEFNQEYRWHYHLIKVHGITADKVNLFR